MLKPIAEVAEFYGVKRKSIRQAARRHSIVAKSLKTNEDGEVFVETDTFDLWWNGTRDAHMDDVRQGKGS